MKTYYIAYSFGVTVGSTVQNGFGGIEVHGFIDTYNDINSFAEKIKEHNKLDNVVILNWKEIEKAP